MVGLLALTLILTTQFDVDGLPALPAIAIGFLLPNADLLWRAWRERGLEVRSELSEARLSAVGGRGRRSLALDAARAG